MLVTRTRVKEAKMAERFGDAYWTYARRTGRFLPRLGLSPLPSRHAHSPVQDAG